MAIIVASGDLVRPMSNNDAAARQLGCVFTSDC